MKVLLTTLKDIGIIWKSQERINVAIVVNAMTALNVKMHNGKGTSN